MAFARKLAVLFVFALGAFAPASQAAPYVAMSVTPATIDVGGTSRVQLYIYDSYGGPTSIVGATISGFNYPANLVNAAVPNVTTNTCTGTITANPGAGSLSATGVNIPAFFACIIEFDVTSAVPALYAMTFPAGAFNGNTGANPTDTITSLAVTPPLIVTTTADSGPGSLRQVLTDANAICATDPNIRFNIAPNIPPLVISPLTDLPRITCPGTTIDATTQSGWAANTATNGTNNATIPVHISGGSCTGCSDGLYFSIYGAMKGLAVYGFPTSAVTAWDSITIQGSYLGVRPGSLSMSGGTFGALIAGGSAQIGGPAAADANVITGNTFGVQIESRWSFIEGNLIGGDPNGGPELGNRQTGVLLVAASYATSIRHNFIRYNGAAGIGVENGSNRNVFSMNASFANAGPGIDLKNDGPTPNGGAAYPFNYPVITSVRHVGADTVIDGYVKSVGGPADVELYHNSVRPPPTITEGEKFIGGTRVNLDGTGYGTFNVTVPGFLADNVSAADTIDTCGDGCVASSEYSPPFGGAPTATITPKLLAFNPRGISSTSPPQTATLTNDGPGPLTIGSAAVRGDFAFTTNCPASIANGASCTFDVTFTPLAAGGRTGDLTINTDAVGSPHVVTLTGTGETNPVPEIILVPGTLEFAPQRVGTESALQFPTVLNVGAAPLVFGAIAASGDFSVFLDFTSALGPCISELAPGASCEIGVLFRPGATGVREGAITIESNAPGPAATLRLVGTGVATAPPRMLSVPASLAFDGQRVGTASPGLAVTITNNSATVVSITDLSASGDFSVSDTCTTIPARGSCSPLVTFLPRAQGERSGTLTIRALSEELPYLVPLRGLGLFNSLPELAASLSQAGFGNTFVGSASRVTFDLRNMGEVPVVIESIAPVGEFFVSHSCGTIAVLGTCTVTVYFVPHTVGRQVGSLVVLSNAERSPLRIDLSGIGCAIPSVSMSRFGALLCGAP